MGMQIYPAIDLKGGQCVRLRQGRAEEATVYSADPVAMAKHWEREGGDLLHVVDLDGAFQGRPAHAELIGKMARAVSMPVEVGGGLRTDADIETLLNLGVRRVILGTRAWSEPGAMERLVARFGGERIVAGIDARDGRVQIKGWVETTDVTALDLARRMEAAGVRTIIYTDTATDGMMAGPNLASTAALCDAVRCDVVASGGISTEANLRDLAALGRGNLVGAIVGKALYEGTVSVASLKRAAAAGEGA